MTISRVGVGAVSHGTTSVSPAYPAGYTAVANDIAVIVVASGHTTVGTIPAASNYQNVGSAAHTGANPTYGLDTGPRRLTFLVGHLAASQAAPTVTLASGDVLSAYVLIYRSSVAGTNFQFATAFGADNSSAVNVSAATAALGMAPNDELVQAWTVTPDTATLSAFTRTATGVTFGSVGTLATAANTNGNDLGIGYIQLAVATGTTSVAVTSGATTSAAASGETGILRIREGAPLNMGNTFEGGTDGVGVTIGNSGGSSGTAFDFITTSLTGGSLTYDDVAKFRGNLGARLVVGGTAGIFLIERVASLNGFQASSPLYMRYRVRAPIALPGVDVRLSLVADSTGAFCCDIRLTTAGKIELRTGTGTLIGTSTATFSAGQWIDIGFAILKWGTTNGQAEIKLYDSAGAVSETITSGATIDTLRGGGLNKIQFGSLTSTTNVTFDYDDTALSTTGYPATPTPISQTTDLRWKSYTAVSQTTDLRWKSAAQVTQTTDLRWKSYVRISQTTDLRWKSYTALSQSVDLRWKSYVRISQTSDHRWKSYAQISQTTDLRWKSYVRISQTSDHRWKSYVTIFPTISFLWKSYTPVTFGSVIDLRWKSAGQVSNSLDVRWKSYTGVSQTTDIRWKSYTQVAPKDVDLRWRTYIDVLSDLDIQYRIYNRLSSDCDIRWRDYVAIAPKTVDLRWTSFGLAQQDVDLRWKVLSASIQVQQTLDLQWRSFAQVVQPLDLRWRSRVSVDSDVDLLWNVLAPVAADLDLRWLDFAIAANVTDLRWRVFEPVEGEIDLAWKVIGGVNQTLSLLWKSEGESAPANPEDGFIVNVAPRVVKVNQQTGAIELDALPVFIADMAPNKIWIVERQ